MHDGHTPGLRANAVRFTERPLFIAYVLNDELVKMPRRDVIERIVFGDGVLLPPRRRNAAPIDAQRVTGVYALDDENRIRVSLDNGVLQAGAIGQRAIDPLLGEVPGANAANGRAQQAIANPEGEFATWWREQCAAASSARIRGTALRSPSTLQTFVACRDKMLRLVWRGEELTAWGGNIAWPGVVPLRQYDADSFVAFENLLATRVAQLAFRGGHVFVRGEPRRLTRVQ